VRKQEEVSVSRGDACRYLRGGGVEREDCLENDFVREGIEDGGLGW
jgi:hypothetical protein